MTTLYIPHTPRTDIAPITPPQIRTAIARLSSGIADCTLALAGMREGSEKQRLQTRRAAMIDQREKYRRRLG